MIIVTGATGNVGQQVVKQLSDMGQQFRVLVRNPQKAVALAGPGVEIVVGDFEDPNALDRALEGVSKAFLLSNISERQTELQNNFIDAARRAGVKHIVKGAAIGTDLNSPVSYLRWHAEIEQHLAESGLDYTNIHPHIFMQQGFEFAPTIAAQGAMYGPFPNEAQVAPVDVRDIAAVVVQTLLGEGHAGQTYTVTGPNVLTFPGMAEIFTKVLGKPVNYMALPSREAAKGVLLQIGFPDWWANDIVTMCYLFAEQPEKYAFTTDTVERIGKKQPLSYEQFVRDHQAIFQGEAALAQS